LTSSVAVLEELQCW